MQNIIAEELPNYLKQWFKIPTQKENTFIAGESMGGYGALKIGMTYPSQYKSNCGFVTCDSFRRITLHG